MIPARRPCDLDEWRERVVREIVARRGGREYACPSVRRRPRAARVRDGCLRGRARQRR